MKLEVIIYPDEDGILIAECPSIPGCVSQGHSQLEAQKNILDAIKECLKVRKELGMSLTVQTHQVEVEVNA